MELERSMGKIFMFCAAFFAATGQLFWKLGINNFLYMPLGFILYGVGAVLMIKSLQMEKLSVAYPIMCTSYIIALCYGYIFLEEQITVNKLIAVSLLFIGVTLTSYED